MVSPGQVTRQWSSELSDEAKNWLKNCCHYSRDYELLKISFPFVNKPKSFWNVESDPLDPTGKLLRTEFWALK